MTPPACPFCTRIAGGELLIDRELVAATAQASQLRTLPLAGDDADRRAVRTTLSNTAQPGLAGRELLTDPGREHAVSQGEIARLALALGQARCQLKDNRAQLLAIVEDLAPGLTGRYGAGPGAPVVRWYELGEHWYWCYLDQVLFELEGAPSAPSHP